MHSAPVLFEELSGEAGNLGLITLNRPKALNALTHEMIILMQQKLIEWENNVDIKAVVVKAAEGRAFCAGGDLRLVHEKNSTNDPTLLHFFRDEYRLNHYIFHYPKPYLAFLDGITMGGGAGISIHGSYRIGTEHLTFAMPETGIGFFPDVGGSYFLSRLPHGVGFYLGLTGARLNADDCLDIKLIDYKIQSANLPLILRALRETAFQGRPHEVINHILHQFREPFESSALVPYYSFIQEHFLKHTVEEIIAALQHQMVPWHQETLATLQKKSPMSLKVSLQELHEAVKRDFDQCIQLEYHLMSHFIQSHDFFEGIRAVVIEKHQHPRWQPAELKQVSAEMVASYFVPLAGEAAQLLFT